MLTMDLPLRGEGVRVAEEVLALLLVMLEMMERRKLARKLALLLLLLLWLLLWLLSLKREAEAGFLAVSARGLGRS